MFSLREHDHGDVVVTLSFLYREKVTSVAPCPDPSVTVAASTEADLGMTMEAFPPGESPQASHSLARFFRLAKFPDEFDGSREGELNFSFGAREDDEFSIATLEGGLMPSDSEDSAGPPAIWYGCPV